MLKSTTQESWKYRVAAFNKRLHRNQICPANHTVEYANGWYYYDGEPQQRPEITRRAKELEGNPNVEVRYNQGWNTYVFPAEVKI